MIESSEALKRFQEGGALLIDKPQGLSSFEVIEQLRRLIAKARQHEPLPFLTLGHTGTLDPFATGLLVILVGRAVQLAFWLLSLPKRYTGVASLGRSTLSGDGTTDWKDVHSPEQVKQVLEKWTLEAWQQHRQRWIERLSGEPYWQRPPMFSAKRVQGRRLYELARRGQEIDRPLQHVQILDWQVSPPYWEGDDPYPRVHFEVSSSGGTYVRTFLEDWAAGWGELSFLLSLRREAVGGFERQKALSLDQAKTLSVLDWSASAAWVPWNQVLLGHLPALSISKAQALALSQGQQRGILAELQEELQRVSAECQSSAAVALFDQEELVGILKQTSALENTWKLSRVFFRKRES